MIETIRGKLIHSGKNRIILELHGIGYGIYVTDQLICTVQQTNAEDVFLWIYDCIKEDLHELYGFAAESEKKVFTILLSVSGIGPKLAMKILSDAGIELLLKAIREEDVSMLRSIKGLGEKTASRLILELKNKVSGLEISCNVGLEKISETFAIRADAAQALKTLGYKEQEIRQVLKECSGKALTLEETIRSALVFLSGK